MYPSIYSSIHPLIQPINPSNYPSTHLTHLSIHSSNITLIHPQSTHPSVIHLSIHPPICPVTHPPTNPSIHLSIHPPISQHIHPSIHFHPSKHNKNSSAFSYSSSESSAAMSNQSNCMAQRPGAQPRQTETSSRHSWTNACATSSTSGGLKLSQRPVERNKPRADQSRHQEEKMGWIGRTLRKPPTNITRQALDWNPQGKRKVGRPRQTWWRRTDSDAKAAGMTWAELKRIAPNRVRWRNVVAALCSSKEQEA